MLDIKEFDTIVEKYRRLIYVYCLDKVDGDTFRAEEITNDVFIFLYKNWHMADTIDNMRAYLYEVAKNYIRNSNRTNRTYSSKIKSLEEAEEDFDIGVIKNLIYEDTYFDDKDAPIDFYLEKIKEYLPAEYKEIFHYRFIENKKLKYISELTGIPYSSLRHKIKNIEKIVRKEIKKIFDF